MLISQSIWKAKATGVGGRLIVTMPPRHGKSELISHWVPSWYLHNWPKDKVIITTYEEHFAKQWGRRTRNTINQHESIRTFLSKDTKAAGEWETDKGGGMLASGVGGPITGRGFHLGIIDDPVKNWIDAQSKTIRQNIIDWFLSTFYTRAEPGATIILLMTRWHENDLAGFLIKEHDDNWQEIRFPALAEGKDVLGRARGDALCPERYTDKRLKKIKAAVGAQIWAGLYQQRPAPIEGAIWKLEYWQYYNVRPYILYFIQSWDTGLKDNVGNAFSCCTTWGIGKVGYFLVDVWRQRVQYPELKKAVGILNRKWKPKIVLVEDKASGISVVQDLRRSPQKIPLKSVPVSNKESKTLRGQIAAPTAEAGLVYLPEKAKWLPDFIDEMTAFPNSEFTDQADSTSQAITYLVSKQGRVISGVKTFRG